MTSPKINRNEDGNQAAEPAHPFYITREEEHRLRIAAETLSPALVIDQASSFDEYTRQLMVPPAVMDLKRKAEHMRLAAWEVQGIRRLLEPTPPGGEDRLLRHILKAKAEKDDSHPPYIRVACTGKGDFDDQVVRHGYVADVPEEQNIGSPVVLEIWPAQHFSPMHSHGNTTGIIYCLAGQLDVMSYEELDWDAEKRGLVTLTPGRCAWLSGSQYAVHKVYCPLDGGPAWQKDDLLNDTGDFAASFHVYLNEDETGMDEVVPGPMSRNEFEYIEEKFPHDHNWFETHSDLSWKVLRAALADEMRNLS
ncbi:hypothetical protein [Streptomyces sp. HNM0574]|uniref:hypothetical protein n=1 Tax=Streptomyces sp. HNM0574 TaxID=2714954 RepID=UPI00146CCBA8|nr:hypothetical protein [Streptomyces sp. HNM0574]NLU67002.1 hypothetical protein [Streptomyces sp. HNM0574]